MSLPEQFLNASEAPKLDPRDNALFLGEWDQNDGDLTDEQILMAIKTGQL